MYLMRTYTTDVRPGGVVATIGTADQETGGSILAGASLK